MTGEERQGGESGAGGQPPVECQAPAPGRDFMQRHREAAWRLEARGRCKLRRHDALQNQHEFQDHLVWLFSMDENTDGGSQNVLTDPSLSLTSLPGTL